MDLWTQAWSGRFAERSGTLTQLAQCTAAGSARRSGRLRRVASRGRASDALLLGLTTHVSGWTRDVALCRWDWRGKCLAGRLSWRCAVGSCGESVALVTLRRWDWRQNCLAGEERGEERREEMKGERREERREDRRGDVFSYRVMSSRIMSCHVMSCHVMSCHVTSRHVMSCYVMSRHSCHVIHVVSGQVLSCRLAWHRFVYTGVCSRALFVSSSRVLSGLVASCLCRVVSCHVVSSHVTFGSSSRIHVFFSRVVSSLLLSRHVMRCQVIQYHVIAGG